MINALSYCTPRRVKEVVVWIKSVLRKPPSAIFVVNCHVNLLVNLLRNHLVSSQICTDLRGGVKNT